MGKFLKALKIPKTYYLNNLSLFKYVRLLEEHFYFGARVPLFCQQIRRIILKKKKRLNPEYFPFLNKAS